MPELPEVDTVRAGLGRWVLGRRITDVEVRHPRAVRRHGPGAADFAARLRGARLVAACRRGKYLWLPLAHADARGDDEALVAHLGMSGQLLIQDAALPQPRHLHVRIVFDSGPELRFVDQRTFGGLLVDDLVPAADRPVERLPSRVAHIARDPLDPYFDDLLFRARLRRRSCEIKRALLDQSLVSGIGNIYADEALWRARLHGQRIAAALRGPQVAGLLDAVRSVLGEALEAGGTSFDSLYVNVDGASGYFARSLAVYGRSGEPCPRCGVPIRRSAFMNRSSYFCPACQRRPVRRNVTPVAAG